MKNVLLPCNTTIVVREFNGRIEKMLTDEEAMKAPDIIDKLLIECIVSVEGKSDTTLGKKISELLLGSRTRALIEARRLSYGDEVDLEWKCVACGAQNREEKPFNLGNVVDRPYPPEGERELSIHVDGRNGQSHDVVLRLPRGIEDCAFSRGIQKKFWGVADMAFACVKTVDGQPQGQLFASNTAASVTSQIRKQFNAWVRQFGPHTQSTCTCEKCGATNIVHVTSVPDFFHRGLIEQDES